MSNAITRMFLIVCAVVPLTLAPMTIAPAQEAKPFKPQPGQPGKDVMWLPTPQVLVDRMLDMAKLTVDDYVIDLGSGDGRTVITAAKRGAKALGIEFNPDMVAVAQQAAKAANVDTLATFREGDIFKSDFSEATLVTLFLLPDLNLQLRPKLLDMKPNTRVVSNTFTMGDWTPDDEVSAADIKGCYSYCKAFFWIVPAKVAGTWQLPTGKLVLEQNFQMLTGTMHSSDGSVAIKDGRMRGDLITFKVGDKIYNGQVTDKTMEGVFSTEVKFQAIRP